MGTHPYSVTSRKREHMSAFSDLSAAEQTLVREAQHRRKDAKQLKKLQKQVAQTAVDDGCSSGNGPARCTVSRDEYFDACPLGLFRDPSLPPTARSVELLLRVLEADNEKARWLNKFNYFQFSSQSAGALWDARFNARLAWEGFFTITARTGPGRRTEPLPELQPFYGVLTWDNFESSRLVKATLRRLGVGRQSYRLSNCADSERTWRCVDEYHSERHSSNWLTRQYFEMMQEAHNDETVNFSLHCIELSLADDEDDETSRDGEPCIGSSPIAGEIGFSIGSVYTSLTGWTGERTSTSVGTAQLVLLGRWLQRKGYSSWLAFKSSHPLAYTLYVVHCTLYFVQ